MLTLDRINELFSYDKETGVITWKTITSKRAKIGSVAGHLSHGYRIINIDKKKYFAHKIVWMIENGSLPNSFIDHIDGNPLNNVITNLRLATHSQNMFNLKTPITNTSGYKGVHFHKGARKWRSVAWQNNKPVHIGMFDDPIDAAKAYNNWCIQHRGTFARINQL